ncbi:hypothetical protein BG015_001214 [Linnemannia schmuckeri]|uniref:Uncharacterized protein n=1 Tax=Linnemannia schmuckeri TaxID=64567 RepID=A0A9P5RQL2_9FUNG|nr:hypothetical protein BG015_001214 [Linnemannia schmuckeri]
MKFNNIAYLPCTALLVSLVTSGLISAAPIPLSSARHIIATQPIHTTIPNKTHLPIVTPVLYKRQARVNRRLSHGYMKRDLSATATLEEEVSEPKSENSAYLSKRGARGGRRPFDEMKRDLTRTAAN